MKEKRYLTDEELNKIRNERDMLRGNLNRMCVSDDIDELIKMYHYAESRIQHIFDICIDRFIDDKESENNEKKN